MKLNLIAEQELLERIEQARQAFWARPDQRER